LLDDMAQHRQAVLHGAVADAIAVTNPRDVDRLAFHYSRSLNDEPAIRYLRLAAERAADVYANAAAADRYGELVRRLSMLGRNDQAADVRQSLALVLLRLGRYEEARAELEQAMEVYERSWSLDRLADALSLISATYRVRGNAEAGTRVIETFLDERGDRAGDLPRAKLLLALAQLYFPLGRVEDQLAAAREARRLLTGSSEPAARALLGRALGEEGVALVVLGRYDEAAEPLHVGREVTERDKALREVSRIDSALAMSAHAAGNVAAEDRYLRHGLEVAKRLGDTARLAFMLARVGRQEIFMGKIADARAHIEEAVALDRDHPSAARTLIYTARVELAAADNRPEDVARFVAEGKAFAEQMDDRMWVIDLEGVAMEIQLQRLEPEGVAERIDELMPVAASQNPRFHRLKAEACLMSGRVDEAKRAIARAEEEALVQKNYIELPAILRVRAACRVVEGDREGAERLFDDALTRARAMDLPREEAVILGARGYLAARHGRAEEGRDWLHQAWEILERLGQGSLAATTRYYLENLPSE